jgi:hypothetical protein
MHTQSVAERLCPHCGTPIVGRSNKKFCDNSCKAHHFRNATPKLIIHATEVTAPAPVEAIFPPLSSPVNVLAQALLSYPFCMVRGFSQDTSRKLIERYEKIRLYQQAHDPLHSSYAYAVESFLIVLYKTDSQSLIECYTGTMKFAIDEYMTHPGLRIPGHIAHYRLADLRFLYAHLQALTTQHVAAPNGALGTILAEQAPPFISSTEHISDGRVHQLWANLLGLI